MPLTTIDPTAALVVIDLQKGTVGLALAHPGAEIVERSARLARAFRARRLPVVLVNVTAGAPGRTEAAMPRSAPVPDWAEIVPEMEQQPNDLLITKQRWGSFFGTTLDADLKQRGVTQIFLAGISTSRGVESTARGAHELGYNVVLIVDAMTDRNADAHRSSVANIFPSLGETTTTDEVLKRLG